MNPLQRILVYTSIVFLWETYEYLVPRGFRLAVLVPSRQVANQFDIEQVRTLFSAENCVHSVPLSAAVHSPPPQLDLALANVVSYQRGDIRVKLVVCLYQSFRAIN